MFPLLALGLLACKDDASTEDTAWSPELACPGSAGCEDASGALSAGAASLSLLPDCMESWEDVDGSGGWTKTSDGWLDCGCDALCPEDEGYPGPDEGEGDGEFQAIWMGGFSNGHPAQSVGDDIYTRALVLRQGESAVGIVSVDLVGIFNPDVVKVREAAEAAGLDLDHIIISATHAHEGPDTIGLWGPGVGKSGYVEDYGQQVRDTILESLVQADAAAVEVADVRLGSADARTYHEARGSANVLRDTRDPVVANWEIGTLQLLDSSNETIATVINWGCHPETLSDDNYAISSDFAHTLRTTVESGSSWEDGSGREGVGGVAIYLQGAVGGMMTTLRVETDTPDGRTLTGDSFEHTYAIGTLLGEMALDAVESGLSTEPELSFEHSTYELPVDNIAFQAMFNLDVFPERPLPGYDPTQNIDDDNWPHVITDMDHVRLGGLEMLTIPGELFPELAMGGYDGSLTGSPIYEVTSEGNENPPDLSQAPEGPYILDRMEGSHRWIVGLANDEIGYIIPPFNFELHEYTPYLDEAPGHHYEETNSLGPKSAPLTEAAATRLLEWSD